MKTFLIMIPILGALGIAVGAFGAHALEPIISENARHETWNTAIQYYWIHVGALLFLSTLVLNAHLSSSAFKQVVCIWLASMIIFCGSLIAISLGAPTWLGAFTPIGGIGFIVGWLRLIPAFNKKHINEIRD